MDEQQFCREVIASVTTALQGKLLKSTNAGMIFRFDPGTVFAANFVSIEREASGFLIKKSSPGSRIVSIDVGVGKKEEIDPEKYFGYMFTIDMHDETHPKIDWGSTIDQNGPSSESISAHQRIEALDYTRELRACPVVSSKRQYI